MVKSDRADDLKAQLPKLSCDPEFEEFLFHLIGVVEAQSSLVSLLREFEEVYEAKPRKAEKILAGIEIEVYMHLKYHADCLRAPFEAVMSRYYGPGAKISVDDEADDPACD